MRVLLLKARADSLLRRWIPVWFLLVYFGLYAGVIVSRNWTLLESSAATDHSLTALRGILRAFMDGYSADMSSVSLQLSLILVSLNVVLLGFYIGRVKEVMPALGGAGFGLGALLLLIVGIGCLSCGAVVGLALASLFGAGALGVVAEAAGPTLLFGSTLMLFFLAVVLGKKVTDPFVC